MASKSGTDDVEIQTHPHDNTTHPAGQQGLKRGVFQWIFKDRNWLLLVLILLLIAVGLESFYYKKSSDEALKDIRRTIVAAADQFRKELHQEIVALRSEIDSTSNHIQEQFKTSVLRLENLSDELNKDLEKKIDTSVDQIRKDLRQEIVSVRRKIDSSFNHLQANLTKDVLHSDPVDINRGTLHRALSSRPALYDPDGGGELVFLRRYAGSVDFDLGWQEYKEGFGSLYGEFWLGLEKLHLLTSQRPYQLRVDMEDTLGKQLFVVYGSFKVGPESDKFRLSLKDYDLSSTAGDSMLGKEGRQAWHDLHGMAFTTKDNDNDNNEGDNCAGYTLGGWWYNNCSLSWPTAKYRMPPSKWGIKWRTFRPGTRRNLIKYIQLKIRPT